MAGDGTFQIRKGDYRKRLIEFLEHELNLPPKLVAWVRENLKYIEIGLIVFIVVLLSWTGLDYYHQNRLINSSNALTAARAKDDETARRDMMKKVADRYSGTASGTWAAIYLANDSFAKGEFAEAAVAYQAILDKISSDDPARLPVAYRLALTLENNGKSGDALEIYRSLAGEKGFVYLANLSAGRLLEASGDKSAALAAFRAALDGVPAGSGEHDFLTIKVADLEKEGAGKAVVKPPVE